MMDEQCDSFAKIEKASTKMPDLDKIEDFIVTII